MLQTEEVDDDYFTPVAGTSLANIFGSTPANKETTENDSLKYTPPKPQDLEKKPREKPEEKATQCVFACALIGHEWSNNVYISKGKLGFAIIKIQSTGFHNIILYDSNKTTLSSATVSPKLEVSVKNNSYMSYYDNLQRYWSVYGGKGEIEKIIQILSSFGANIKVSSYTDTGPPEPKQIEIPDAALEPNMESDSSVNRKTKASILNRMANMGHSVFPTHFKSAQKTSDSSDTNESSHVKYPRHKSKSNNRRYKDSDIQQDMENQQALNSVVDDKNKQLCPSVNQQFLPMGHTSIITTASNSSYMPNEMGMFMTEQRISNSELRINMNRISDKLDVVLNRVDQTGSNLQNDILMKLLNEYEKRIAMYETMLNKTNNTVNIDEKVSNCEVELKNKINDLELDIKGKSNQIFNLETKINELELKNSEKTRDEPNQTDLLAKISDLENSLSLKDKELESSVEKCDNLQSLVNCNKTEIENKLKSIMNDTFQTISTNFDNNETYSGEMVKKVIGAVIRKITIQTLNDL